MLGVLANGANPNLAIHDSIDVPENGATPLHLAVTAFASNDDLKIAAIRLLLQNHSEIDRQDARGRTVLFLASCLSKPRVVRELLDHGADPTIRNVDTKTALDVAKEVGRKENVEVLASIENRPAVSKGPSQ